MEVIKDPSPVNMIMNSQYTVCIHLTPTVYFMYSIYVASNPPTNDTHIITCPNRANNCKCKILCENWSRPFATN